MPNVAVLGCGYWGKNLVRNFHRLGVLGAIADPVPERLREAARRHDVPGLPVDTILASPEYDAVVLAVPAEQHAEVALRALEAGKHVFVEKPLALTVADGERIAAAARQAGRVVMVGHLLQYHPAFVKLKALCADGALGRLQYICSHRLNLGKFRQEENVFWSLAPHDLSMILGLAGAEPEAVEAVGHCYLHKHIADVTTTHLAFANGINAHVFVSWLHPFKEQKLVVVGDAGMAVFDDNRPWDQKLEIYRHKVVWRGGTPQPDRAAAEPVPLDEAEPLALECRHFLDCVRDGRTPTTDIREGLAVLRVLASAEAALVRQAPRRAQARPQPGWTAHETAWIDDNVAIGAGTRIWHFSHLLGGSTVGRNCVIGQNVAIGPDARIGDRCKIQNNVSVYKGVELEDDVFLGPSCVFTNVHTPRAAIERKAEFRRTHVRRGATIGANATIVCGNELGPYCFVAAGAVVTKPVPAFALVAGNPARRIGWVGHAGERLDPDLVCPRTGRRYALDANGALVDAVAEFALAEAP
ncbi:Gfo/Idh/MocA family oxidoreductase [Marinivivus vitaminiproducens]|uniref:Gfo/Idh/MocA family oxidoreductase n=1 Tax=Marinivivus vitaminiproducens TaxID=3035935 RepID=UPI0027A0685A|nr:Gfo/Idh/MocA family oxidoreductase [Geminicoccaceae bacterium SCSIO 64248]